MRKTALATDCIYHVYNRGVEKRKIFLNPSYFSRFVSILKHCLEYNYPFSLLKRRLEIANTPREKQELFKRLEARRIEPPVEVISFCLMPNHYHLTIQQLVEDGISNFMHRIDTSYTKYFNKRQDRTGRLLESTFKAVRVESEEQLLHLSRYQHINPLTLGLTLKKIANYSWSSLPVYLGKKPPSFVKPKMVLSAFRSPKSYLEFVLAKIDKFEPARLEGIAIDDDFGWFVRFRMLESDRREQLISRYLAAVS